MAIDRYDWHSEGDFPDDLPEVAAGTHIGFFINWLILRGYIGDEHLEDEHSVADIEKVRSGEMTGRDYFFKNCDGKFWDADVADNVLPFVQWYYINNHYYDDLDRTFTNEYESIYHADDSKENAEAIGQIIDQRFNAWKQDAEKGAQPDAFGAG